MQAGMPVEAAPETVATDPPLEEVRRLRAAGARQERNDVPHRWVLLGGRRRALARVLLPLRL
jgi:hypothetical protein